MDSKIKLTKLKIKFSLLINLNRIVICFIESKNKTGSQTLNPFDFQRGWTYTVTQERDLVTDRERFLERKLLDFEKQLALFKACLPTELVEAEENTDENTPLKKGKGKGKGASGNAAAAASQDQAQNSGLLSRLRSSFSAAQGKDPTPAASTSASSISSQPPAYSDLGLDQLTATTKRVFIKQVDLLLNGAPLDQIDTLETGRKQDQFM